MRFPLNQQLPQPIYPKMEGWEQSSATGLQEHYTLHHVGMDFSGHGQTPATEPWVHSHSPQAITLPPIRDLHLDHIPSDFDEAGRASVASYSSSSSVPSHLSSMGTSVSPPHTVSGNRVQKHAHPYWGSPQPSPDQRPVDTEPRPKNRRSIRGVQAGRGIQHLVATPSGSESESDSDAERGFGDLMEKFFKGDPTLTDRQRKRVRDSDDFHQLVERFFQGDPALTDNQRARVREVIKAHREKSARYQQNCALGALQNVLLGINPKFPEVAFRGPGKTGLRTLKQNNFHKQVREDVEKSGGDLLVYNKIHVWEAATVTLEHMNALLTLMSSFLRTIGQLEAAKSLEWAIQILGTESFVLPAFLRGRLSKI